jgi:hypothetical protein
MRLPRRCERLQLIKKPPAAVEIDVDADGRLSQRQARRFLATILAQAIHDGMFALRLHVTKEPARVSLTYLGLDSEGKSIEWAMTPPPPATYPYLLQAALTVATLEPGFPLRGVIFCDGIKGTQEVAIEVSDELETYLCWEP